MLIRRLEEMEEFTAGDDSLLRELIHPGKQEVKLRYSFAHATVKAGQTTQPHKLKNCSEVYYILEGKGIMTVDDESAGVYPGCLVYIAPGSLQYIKNTGDDDLKFVCIVDPAWKPENEQVLGESRE